MLIYNNRILTSLDPDAESFFERAGLNRESNLDVDGLYTAEQARYWVNWLVKGIKSLDAWQYFKDYAIYLHLGGTSLIASQNLCSSDYQITWIDSFTFDKLGSKPDNSNSRGNTTIKTQGFEEFHTIGFNTNDDSNLGILGSNLDIASTAIDGTYSIDLSANRTGSFNNTIVSVSGDYNASYQATVLSGVNLGNPIGTSVSRRDGWGNFSIWKEYLKSAETNDMASVYTQSALSEFYLCGNESNYSLRRHCVDYFTPNALSDFQVVQINKLINQFNKGINRI